MSIKTIPVPQGAIVSMLRGLPENVLHEIFWQVFAEWDTDSLDWEEEADIAEADIEFKRGETIKWENIH